MARRARSLAVLVSVALGCAVAPACNSVSGVDEYLFDRACVDAVKASTEDCSTIDQDENCDGVPRCSADGLWSRSFGWSGAQRARGVAFDRQRNVIVVGDFDDKVNLIDEVPLTKGGADIFVAKFGTDGTLVWGKRFGNELDQYALSVAVDSEDNVILAGTFTGTVTFGDLPLTASNGSDIFVAKFDSKGNHIWSKSFIGDKNQSANAVAVDSSNNILLTGSFEGWVDFGDGGVRLESVDPSTADVFVAKLSRSGEHIFSDSFGDVLVQEANTIAAGPDGRFYIGGLFQGSLGKLKDNVDLASSGEYDAFAIAFAEQGTILWASKFGDQAPMGNAANQELTSMAVDPNGALFITGSFAGALKLGEGFTSAGANDLFLAKLGPAGDTLWAKGFGSELDESAGKITADGAGNVVLTGSMIGTVDFGDGPRAGGSMPTRDVFIAKLTATGEAVATPRFTSAGDQAATAVAVDALGNIALAGVFTETVTFSGEPLKSVSTMLSDGFIAVFRP